MFEGSQELGQLLRIMKKMIYLRRKSRGRKRPQLEEKRGVCDSLGCTKQQRDGSRQAAGKPADFWE